MPLRPTRPFFLLVAILLVGGAACDLSGPAPGTTSGRTVYGPSGLNTALDVTPRSDGGLLVAGYAEGAPGPTDGLDSRPLFLRVDSEGAVAAETVYRDLRSGAAHGAVPFGEGLAVMVDGEGRAPAAPDRNDAVLYRTDGTGTRVEVLFEAPDAFLPRQALVPTADGGLLLALSRAPSDTLVKLDRRGDRAWAHGLPEGQAVTGVAEARDRTLWVLGRRDARRFTLIRLAPDGCERGRRTYGADTLRRATALAAVGDGAAVLQTRSVPETTRETMVVTRVDDAGTVQWRREYAEGHLGASSIAARPDGGLAFGYTAQHSAEGDDVGRTRASVVWVAADGTVQRREPFGDARRSTRVSAVAVRPDGRVVAGGATGPPGERFRSRLLVEQYREE